MFSVTGASFEAMVAEELLGDARVRKLSFTGSTAVGQALLRRYEYLDTKYVVVADPN